MEAVKKWLAERSTKKDGIYVHYSPPKAVGASAAQLRQWARSGLGSKLERAVLAGHGRRLLAEAHAQLGPAAAPALRALAVRCAALHAAVERGSLAELQELLDNEPNRRKSVMCCDEAGVGLLHKAVYYDYMDIAEWLVDNYPQLVHQKDSEGRTALHYTGGCRDAGGAAALLERAGAARGARDAAGRTPAHYQHHRTPPALPAPPPLTDAMPPGKHPQALAIKRHNIRIWCHDCDMARLQRVVWEGHGARLLSEVSNQPVVKRFLEAVPYIMNTIREIHNTVVQNDLEGLIKLAGDPVPPQALSSRDANYMTVLHKAAGLGHASMVKYIVDRYPQGINDVDNDGRSPLHYAAIVKDDRHTYNTLVGFGADEGAVDNKNRTPGYYLNRPQDIDKNFFKTLPEAPRTASSAYPPQWDWKLLDTEVVTDLNKKPKKKGSNVNGLSNKSNSVSDNTVDRVGMKTSSTNEFIKRLPDLEDNTNRPNNNVENSKDQEVIEKEHTENNLEINHTESSTTESNLEDTGHEIKDGNICKVDTIIESETNIETASSNEDDIVREADKADLKSESPETARELTQEIIDEYHGQNEGNINAINKESESTTHDKYVEDIANKNYDLSQKLGNLNDEEVNHLKLEDIANEDEDVPNENVFESTDVTQSIVTENKSIKEIVDDKSLHKTDSAKENKLQESEPNNLIEGNLNSDNNEDDDDVQVQGDCNSEYSDSNLRSTAEATDTKSAKRGNVNNGRNTQESLIEGIINGEAELESQDASILQKDDPDKERVSNMVDNEIDPEVTELISTANMEMLAALVLNGEGARLVGRTSRNSELQAFLDNVPTYMQKINRVHIAAKEGNIKELQAALDRRKFAIARDPISSNGATPLHVATVFGKTNIVKYLGGRFPETLSAVDFEGRTALHYAAVLPDNGHYYNLLQQLGSNSKDLDDNGRSAEDYFKSPTLFPFKQLLAEFDISEEAAKDMLSDKSTDQSLNGHMDIPIFRTEEGRYLAKSLGDPLIKGLTEVANAKPKDPVAFLATFLQNFPDHEKPRLGTQETNVIVTSEGAEVENEHPPPSAHARLEPEILAAAGSVPVAMAAAAVQAEKIDRQRTAVRPRPIDVVTVDPHTVISPDAPEIAFSSTNRDEHGQSMLHFAAARTHTHNALFQLLQESDVSLAYRDELYRTARDVSIQANVPENTAEIDKWVLHLAARGNSEKIMEFLLEGYDHILDVVDEEGVPIVDVISQRGHSEMSSLLASIPAFEDSRESLHRAARRGDLETVTNLFTSEGGRTLARAKNFFGRTILHISVLAQQEDVVDYLAQNCPELLRIGDNLERTPLHYAMGVDKMESLSRVLIRAGAKRVLKDLKGRQPSYYFMNKSDILRLKEEEDIK